MFNQACRNIDVNYSYKNTLCIKKEKKSKKKKKKVKSDIRNTTLFTTKLCVTNYTKVILAFIYYIVDIH